MNPQTTIEDTERLVKTHESLVARVTDAQKALEISSKAYKKAWEEWRKIADTMLPEVRAWRMAVDAELSKSLASFADVRAFFLSEKHDSEVEKLRDFVQLLERLKTLKDCGFLDKVADMILKMEGVK